MTDQKHEGFTPGPWRDTEGGIIDNGPPRGHAGTEIADVYGADVHDGRGPEFTIAQANARLIAAAPTLLKQRDELLEAAKNMIGIYTQESQKRNHAAAGRAFDELAAAIKNCEAENE